MENYAFVDEKKNKPNKILKNVWLWRVIILIFSLGAAFFIQSIYYKPDLGTFLGSDMDQLGNVYVLGVKELNEQYKITKLKSDGVVEFEKDLEKSGGSFNFIYRNIEVDSKGNVYVVRELRNLSAVVSSAENYPIEKESVMMFDTHGTEIKKAMEFDFSSNMPTQGYIKKVQVAGQKLTVIGMEKNRVDVITVNPYTDESPSKDYSFSVVPPIGTEEVESEWINDVSVLSDGNLFYATKRGGLFKVDPDGNSVNLNSILSGFENSIVSMCVDRVDNIYFTDILSGTFYKMNTKSVSATPVFALEDSIKINNIKIKDLRRIKVINEDDFYASSKNFENPFYVRLGSSPVLTLNIRYSLLPWTLAYTLAGALILAILIFGLWALIEKGFNRIPVAVRIAGLFFPVFLIIMSSLIYIISFESLNDYTNILRNSQNAGAKIIAEKIDGSLFESTITPSKYMSVEYARVNLAIKDAYSNLNDKIGDTSDYIMLYAVKGNKIYSVANNRYSSSSKSYSKLKFADPDMIPPETALADCMLETEETDTLYSAWDKLRNSGQTTVFAEFRDIRGKISTSFAPIVNDSGSVVGFAGNFIDEKTHITDEFIKILTHAAILIGITFVAVFIYLFLVLRLSLRPLRELIKGIDAMVNGHWRTKIKIKSNDEFSDIARTFNTMSQKIESYTGNLMDLNEEYLRFVPKELLNLAGKEKINQADVNESKVTKSAIVYITFNVPPMRGVPQGNFENFMFKALQESYTKIFKIVESENGVVQNFSSLGVTLLFPKDPKNAISAAFQIFEAKLNAKIKKNMRLGLGYGDVLIGIIGDDIRRGVSMVSDEMLRLIKIDKNIEKLGINFIATEVMIEKISNEFALAYRLLGKFRDVAGVSWVKIYEIIYSSDLSKKEMYINTKNVFERAIQVFENAEFEESRKLFAKVLKQNENDKAALYYLGLCDRRLENTADQSKFTGDIFEI